MSAIDPDKMFRYFLFHEGYAEEAHFALFLIGSERQWFSSIEQGVRRFIDDLLIHHKGEITKKIIQTKIRNFMQGDEQTHADVVWDRWSVGLGRFPHPNENIVCVEDAVEVFTDIYLGLAPPNGMVSTIKMQITQTDNSIPWKL